MLVLTVASRKGGSGKTTLAGHLAVEAERSGCGKVALVDIDPQGSLADWWNARTAPTPLYVNTNLPSLEQDLDRVRAQGVDIAVIDTPPTIAGRVSQAIELSDLVVIPSRPSPHDLRSITATAELVENCGKPLVFVLNGATHRARITSEAISVISYFGPLAPVIIHHRVDFAASMIDGRTVMEVSGAKPAAREIMELWQFLARRLNIWKEPPAPVQETQLELRA